MLRHAGSYRSRRPLRVASPTRSGEEAGPWPSWGSISYLGASSGIKYFEAEFEDGSHARLSPA
eukprot:1159095-Pelagomonas_calceolata.AAC.3